MWEKLSEIALRSLHILACGGVGVIVVQVLELFNERFMNAEFTC
jgi:hypothetical protein